MFVETLLPPNIAAANYIPFLYFYGLLSTMILPALHTRSEPSRFQEVSPRISLRDVHDTSDSA